MEEGKGKISMKIDKHSWNVLGILEWGSLVGGGS